MATVKVNPSGGIGNTGKNKKSVANKQQAIDPQLGKQLGIPSELQNDPMIVHLMAAGVPADMAQVMSKVAKKNKLESGGPGDDEDEDDEKKGGADDTGVPTDPSRAQLVTRWHSRIKSAKKFFSDPIEKMRKDMEYTRNGCDKSKWDPDTQYTANLVQRQISVTTAALYATNPRVQAKRKPRLDFKLWDGDPASITAAIGRITVAGQQAAQMKAQAQQSGQQLDPTQIPQPSPQDTALLQELQQVNQLHRMLDKVGKTLEILGNYFINQQSPNFKQQMKKLVRRAKTTGVAYIELEFQRLFEPRVSGTSEIADTTNQLAVINRLEEEKEEGDLDDDAPENFELETMQRELAEQPNIIAREGPVFNFPESTSVIVDPKCRDLATFIGSEWIAIEMPMTPDQVRETFDIDVGSNYEIYKPNDTNRAEDAFLGDAMWQGGTDGSGTDKEDKSVKLCCVWKVYDRKTATVMVLVDGYKDFVRAPETPEVQLERFYPVFSLVLNDVEDDNIYPPSDAFLMRHPQDEYNRSRQSLREHRRANRPKYIVAKGRLEDEDLKKLANHPANAVLELSALDKGEKCEDMIQPMKTVGIDAQLYDVKPAFDDIERTVGSQQANFGGTSGATATESSIAESTRTSVAGCDADAIDEMLSEVMTAAGEAMLMNLDTSTVQKIVGPGAIWPQVDREQIIDNIYLDIKAGSTGRPNKAAELANLERGMPFLIQMPGLSSAPLTAKLADLLDIDIEDSLVDGLPSITQQNAGQQPQTGNPATNPASQGGAGAQNAPVAPQSPGAGNMMPAGQPPAAPPPSGPRPKPPGQPQPPVGP